MFLLGGLCPWSPVPSRRSLSRGSLSIRLGGLCRETPPDQKSAVRISWNPFLFQLFNMVSDD